LLDIPPVPVPFSLANASAASSWEEGMRLSLVPIIDAIAQFDVHYWSPASPASPSHSEQAAPANPDAPDAPAAAPAAAEPFLLIDGGDYENVHLIGMLQRRVRSTLSTLPLDPNMRRWADGRVRRQGACESRAGRGGGCVVCCNRCGRSCCL
jgi:hypothetical protein